jgi:hypothetical protein
MTKAKVDQPVKATTKQYFTRMEPRCLKTLAGRRGDRFCSCFSGVTSTVMGMAKIIARMRQAMSNFRRHSSDVIDSAIGRHWSAGKRFELGQGSAAVGGWKYRIELVAMKGAVQHGQHWTLAKVCAPDKAVEKTLVTLDLKARNAFPTFPPAKIAAG